MISSDRLADNRSLTDLLRNVLDDGFADLARLHDKLIEAANIAYQRPTDADCDIDPSLIGRVHRDLVAASDYGRAADMVKATMRLRFPEASDAWWPHG